MTNNIQLDINAKNNASPVIKQVAGDISGLEVSGQQATQGLTGVNSEVVDMGFNLGQLGGYLSIATTLVTAFVSAFEFGEIAAGNERLITSGRHLADSYGESLDRIIAKVDEASLGTVSDMDIITSANKAMMLGVGGSAEQLAELMEIAAFRGRAMGLDTTQAFDDMVRGIGRMSPMILDNLGIVVDAEGTYAKYAESIGKSSGELTRAEKIQALLNKVIEEGNRQLEEAGGLVEDNATHYERWNAELENTKNFLLEDTIQMARFADMGADLLASFRELADNGFGYGGEKLNLFSLFMEFGASRVANMREEQYQALASTEAHGEALMGVTTNVKELTEAEQAEALVSAELAKARSEYYTNVLSGAEKYYDVNQRFIEQQENLKTKQQEVKAEIDTLISQGWSPYSDKVQGLQGEYDNLGVKIEEAAQKHREKLAEMQYDLLLAKLSADGLTDAEYAIATAAGVAFGVFDQEAADAQMAQMELTNAVAEGRLRVEDYGRMMKSAMSDGVVSASELRGMIDSIPTEKTVTVNVIGRGMESLRNTSYWNSEKGNGYAKGTDGWMTVPSGYPNDSYPILLTSGERFAVIPNGVQASPSPAGGFGGGGGVNVTLVIQSPVNLSTEEQAKNVLMPFIESGISELVSRGVIPNVYQ